MNTSNVVDNFKATYSSLTLKILSGYILHMNGFYEALSLTNCREDFIITSIITSASTVELVS